MIPTMSTDLDVEDKAFEEWLATQGFPYKASKDSVLESDPASIDEKEIHKSLDV
jgi:hypothetical protein